MAVPFDVGAFVSIGGRKYLEDFLAVIKNLNDFIPDVQDDLTRSFFAVFDGHGGGAVSQYLSKQFHLELARHPKIITEPVLALEDVWRQMDEKCFGECRRIQFSKDSLEVTDGSTATVCLIIGTDLYVCNCGDSSAAGFQENGQFVSLTDVHGTETESEIARCIAAGGNLKPQYQWVPMAFPFCFLKRRVVVGKKRLFPGGLLVTRAFGDFYAKRHELGGNPNVLICDHGPIRHVDLLTAPLKYLVLASDGLWDGLTEVEVFNTISPPPVNQHTGSLFPGRTHSGEVSVRSNTSRFQFSKRIVPAVTNEVMVAPAGPSSTLNSQRLINIVGRLNHLNESAVATAEKLCEAAMKSPYWITTGSPPDNTSCIFVEFRPSTGLQHPFPALSIIPQHSSVLECDIVTSKSLMTTVPLQSQRVPIYKLLSDKDA